MKDALHFFERMLIRETKRIWLQGTQGFDRLKQYSLAGINNKKFYGFQLHTYCFVSYTIALPKMLVKLQLRCYEEFLLARNVKNRMN
ncbi:MAG: hypothetical protein BWY27_01144 [Bacteroidetes bacterium ADurb.Bin234]|nr:MAG: hypothetical protein BWY27_01144 [Bacteroidetes bacterium ADurb.Bin234]